MERKTIPKVSYDSLLELYVIRSDTVSVAYAASEANNSARRSPYSISRTGGVSRSGAPVYEATLIVIDLA